MSRTQWIVVIGSFILLLGTALSPVGGNAAIPSQGVVERNYWPTEGWITSSPEEQGMDSGPLNELMDKIEEHGIAIDSLLIARHGYLVFEEYPRHYTNESRHDIHSCTKSYTSALLGIAIEQGYINSTDDRMVDLLPDRTFANLDSRKEAITLEHLLTMTSGLEWDEWSYPYSSNLNSHYQMWAASNQIQYIIDRPMVANPGQVWTYNSGGSHVLGAIISDATNRTLVDFAVENLFAPLGIEESDIQYTLDNQGYYLASGGASMVPRDMLKFAYLYLNNGTWDGEQIVPADWVQLSSETLVDFNDFSGYSYQWWTYPTEIVNVYAAQGYLGQYIFVVPELDLVVVFTSSITPSESTVHPALLFDYIIPSVLGIGSQTGAVNSVTLIAMAIIPLPVIIAGVYHQYRVRKWSGTLEDKEEMVE
ncbi:MAG: serine hydrolase domain-containing protein [Candidatus Thorarchaeota archaeon]